MQNNKQTAPVSASPLPADGQQNPNEFDDLMPKPSKARKIATIIINTILVIAIILAAICTYLSYVSTSGHGVPNLFGVRIMSVQTNSMFPTLKEGDMILEKGVKNTKDLKPGDIITYWTVINGERKLNTHRILNIYDGGNGKLIFETKGDNNDMADVLNVYESDIVGLYSNEQKNGKDVGTKISGLGKVFDYLQTSNGFLFVVVIPVAVFFLFHLIQFFRVLFEYNNIKNKLSYEMERGKTEDLVEGEKNRMGEIRRQEREKLEAELREKLKAELLAASGNKNGDAAGAKEDEGSVAEEAEEAAEADEADEDTAGSGTDDDEASDETDVSEDDDGETEDETGKDSDPDK